MLEITLNKFNKKLAVGGQNREVDCLAVDNKLMPIDRYCSMVIYFKYNARTIDS